jgi:hypothetical protein
MFDCLMGYEHLVIMWTENKCLQSVKVRHIVYTQDREGADTSRAFKWLYDRIILQEVLKVELAYTLKLPTSWSHFTTSPR